MSRGKALIGVWVLLAMELLYLFAITERPHDTEEFVFRTVVVFVTLVLGSVTVFALPKD